MTLIGDAGASFAGGEAVLHGSRSPDYERVLAIIDGVCPAIRNSKVKPLSHATTRRDGQTVVNAGSGALKNVDDTELRYRTLQRVDAGRKGTSKRWQKLPRRKGINI